MHTQPSALPRPSGPSGPKKKGRTNPNLNSSSNCGLGQLPSLLQLSFLPQIPKLVLSLVSLPPRTHHHHHSPHNGREIFYILQISISLPDSEPSTTLTSLTRVTHDHPLARSKVTAISQVFILLGTVSTTLLTIYFLPGSPLFSLTTPLHHLHGLSFQAGIPKIQYLTFFSVYYK
jgi:hypothetical protein